MTWLGNRLTHSKYLSYINHRTNSFVSLHKKCYPWKVFFLYHCYMEMMLLVLFIYIHSHVYKKMITSQSTSPSLSSKKTVREQFKKESTVQLWIWYLPRYPKFKRKFLCKKGNTEVYWLLCWYHHRHEKVIIQKRDFI